MIKTIVYKNKREQKLSPNRFNLIIGSSGSGKTLFLKSLFASICHNRTGVPLEEVKSQMLFDSDIETLIEFEDVFSGTVFFIPSCDAYFYRENYTDMPLHIRKTLGVYRSWLKRGYSFDDTIENIATISEGNYGGVLKIKVFMAVQKEISSGDILLVDLIEAGVDAILWKWWIDRIKDLVSDGVQVFLSTHDFFVYTYIRTIMEKGTIFYFDGGNIKSFSLEEGIPEDSPILKIPLEVLESAM